MSDEKQYHAALQRIGTALGLPAGSDLTKACVPAIEALKASAHSVGEPVAWTLTEELQKRETTCRAHLWFVNPRNSSWTPLYTPAASAKTDKEHWLDGTGRYATTD